MKLIKLFNEMIFGKGQNTTTENIIVFIITVLVIILYIITEK